MLLEPPMLMLLLPLLLTLHTLLLLLLAMLLPMLLPLSLDTPESLPPQLSTPTLLLDTDMPGTTMESVRLRPSLRLMLTPLDTLMPPDMLMLFPPTPPDMDMDVLAMLVLAMLVLAMLLVATLVPSMVKLNLTGTSLADDQLLFTKYLLFYQ